MGNDRAYFGFWATIRLLMLAVYAGLGICIAGLGLFNLILLVSGRGQSKYFDNPALVLSVNGVCLGIGALLLALFYALKKGRKWHASGLVIAMLIWIAAAILAVGPMTFDQFKNHPIENSLYGVFGIILPIAFTVFVVKNQSNLFQQHNPR